MGVSLTPRLGVILMIGYFALLQLGHRGEKL